MSRLPLARRRGRGAATPDLADRVVVITGGARGIGALLARRVVEQGGRVALLDLSGSSLEATVASLGDRAHGWSVDVTDGEALARVAEDVVARLGRVDVLVANAGIGSGGSLLLTDPAAYDRVIEVNLLGSVRTVRAFLPAVLESRGYVLQVASLAALTPAPFMSAYCASKSGVEAFAHSLRAELRHTGVDVGVAYLAFTDTDMVREVDRNDALRQMRASMPWPFGATYPLAPAVERLLDGLAHRRPHVYAQRWVGALPAVRGALPGLTARFGSAGVADAERLLREAHEQERRAA